jgi:hypothetical protein
MILLYAAMMIRQDWLAAAKGSGRESWMWFPGLGMLGSYLL